MEKRLKTTISSSEDKAGQYQDIEYTFNSGDNTSGSIAFIKWTEEMVTKILFKKKCGSMMYPLKK